jgi:hypothetical protein
VRLPLYNTLRSDELSRVIESTLAFIP